MSKMEKQFHDEPMRPVMRHWMCATDECAGEMKTTGRGVTTMEQSWLHRCDVCSRESWAERNYPGVVYLSATYPRAPEG